MIEIRHCHTGQVLFRTEADTLAGCMLADAHLTGADLRGMDLSGANLWRANLLNADLTGANLSGAILLGAILWGATLTGTHWDATTRWPYDYPPPESAEGGECGHKRGELCVPRPCLIGRRAPLVSCCGCERCLAFLRAVVEMEREHARQLRHRAHRLCSQSHGAWAAAQSAWAAAQSTWAAASDAGRHSNSGNTLRARAVRTDLMR